MTRTSQYLRLAVIVATIAAVAHTHAWGPRAQRTITGMAIQVIQGKFPGTFRPGDANYERDVLKGAEAGWRSLDASNMVRSTDDAIQLVAAQIQLLSKARTYGSGSYFAYRLGVLSSLVADIMLPYGLAWTPEQEAMQAQVRADIEKHLNAYKYASHNTRRVDVANAREYFQQRLTFRNDNIILIEDDYRRGRGYSGLLKESSQQNFVDAVDAVADVWYTILEAGTTKPASAMSANDDMLANYFVDEIAYQLMDKRNFHQAGAVYENLAALNSTNPAIYEEVGDLYYAFETRQSAERSIREWRIAYELGGANRDAVARKISDHFLREGREYLELADEKGKGETELPSALAAFKQALQYNWTSEAAADLIKDTNKRIAERNERREMTVSIIAKADQIREESDNLVTAGNFGNAIPNYRKAAEILNAVDDEFTDQNEIAQQMKQAINKSISTAISNVQSLASDAIEEGERLEEQHKYDEAQKAYARVASLVSVIPDDHTNTTTQDKRDIIALAERKLSEVATNKQRWEASQQNQPGGAAGGLGAPGAGAPAPALGGGGGRARGRD